jgi:RHS repeat-associated protein
VDDLPIQVGAMSITNEATAGLPASFALANVSGAWGFNAFAELTNQTASFNGASIFAAQMTRDSLGRIAQLTETIGGTTSVTSYAYDAVDRLTGVQRSGVAVESYSYDANGNRLTATFPSGSAVATYDGQDRLVTSGSTAYSYNLNGDLVGKTAPSGSTAYTYDALGNLLSAVLPTQPNPTQIGYLLDGRNRRIGKQVNGTLVRGWLYDGQRIVAEVDSARVVVSRFVYAGAGLVPEYMTRGGATYRIVTDSRGSVRLVVDASSGAIAQRLDYDAFGNVTQDSSPGFQPFGFASGLYDPDTQLTHFGMREYDAATGRWTTRDPILFAAGEANTYAYVGNDPINRVDRSGLDDPGGLGAFAMKALADAAKAAAEAANQGKSAGDQREAAGKTAADDIKEKAGNLIFDGLKCAFGIDCGGGGGPGGGGGGGGAGSGGGGGGGGAGGGACMCAGSTCACKQDPYGPPPPPGGSASGPAPYKPVVKPKLFSVDADPKAGTFAIICGVEVTRW